MAHQCPNCEYETDVEHAMWEHWIEVHRPVSRDSFMQVVNEAADRVIEEMGWEEMRERDAINLMVNLLGEMLDNPDATVEQVMANYSGGADEVRSWWPDWGRRAEEGSSIQG